MGKTILTCIVIAAFACGVFGGDNREENLARFFAGVAMLRTAQGLSSDSVAVLYRELLAACEITTSEAVEFLERSKTDPLKWKIFNESVITVITEQFDAK